MRAPDGGAAPAVYFQDDYTHYIYKSKYSRFDWEKMRREEWPETVERYVTFFQEHLKKDIRLTPPEWDEIRQAILKFEVMPSMRCLMTAGTALARDHIAGYNCAFITVNRVAAFDEAIYVLMCGTGVGFSVERQHVNQLPTVAEEFHLSDVVINVADSKSGWARAFKELTALLYQGQVPKWDVSKVRPEDSVLKTFGGRASGPGPLVALFKFAIDMFKRAAGRKLTSIECHDLMCMIGDAVISGGVRRSALLSLSNLSDDRMRAAKSGQWWENYGWRSLANNSAAYTEKPEMGVFMEEWMSLYKSKSGERGIFNREAAKKACEAIGRDPNHDFGTNPCGEIILRDREFCNLTEVVIRPEDKREDIERKIRIASIIGTWQSTLTDFKYISKKWRDNCEEERLLGVSLTGIVDNPWTNGKMEGLPERLEKWKQLARNENKAMSAKMAWPPSKAITCVKPSGTVSQLVLCGSGIHAWHSEHYVRRVRENKTSPVAQLLVDQGVPYETDVTKDSRLIFSFPIKSPKKTILRDDETAIEQLERWLVYKEHWCEHNPSITVTVKENEWMQVGAWAYEHFDDMVGVSFLPHSDHNYKQAPYEAINKEEYAERVKAMPKVNWDKLKDFEKDDMTDSAKELACSAAGGCEIL